ncbi:MAG: hypothetical protein ACOH2V_00675 [Candidatus Saccharimonadaceae bacterium]
MDYFSFMQTWPFGSSTGNNQQPKDIYSNSALRGYQKRLEYLLVKEQTPRITKEVKKLHKKIEAQKDKIMKKLLNH